MKNEEYIGTTEAIASELWKSLPKDHPKLWTYFKKAAKVNPDDMETFKCGFIAGAAIALDEIASGRLDNFPPERH